METQPWLSHYDDGVPRTLRPYPEVTLVDVVAETARMKPRHAALLFKGARMSYRKLDQLSNDFGTALVGLGVTKGDRVAMLMPNTPQSVIGQLGAWKAGAIVVPVNPLYTEHELEHALTECGAETVLVLTPFYEKVKSIQSRTSVKRVIATNIKEFLPPIKSWLFGVFMEKREGHRVSLRPGDPWLGDLLERHAGSGRPDVAVRPSDPALLLFSGGTTGTPKGAVGSHHALVMAGMQVQAWFRPALDEWTDTLTLVMPLFHVYGNVGVLATGLMGRNTLAVVPNPRDIDDLIDTIRKTRPAFLPGVPTLFIALLEHPDVQSGKVDLKSIRLCISGAAALLTETKNRFETVTGGRVVPGYALTESMMGAAISPVNGAFKPGSVGMPVPDVEIRIVDDETGERALACGEVGEILIGAPQLMMGYWQRPEETADTVRDGWLYTGDLGYLDEEGYLFIVDRKKDVIKPSGFQVWPREVEEVIACHPSVCEVAVAGVPDDYQGEAVKVWIVLNEGCELNVDEIRSHCREKMVGYKVPKHVEFRDQLPKTTVGKILKRELVREHTDSGD